MSTPRATHQQIADAVGVSRVAVSQVLHKSHRARISPEKQREIERVAREMGYVPRNVTTHHIGYVSKADVLHSAGESRALMLVDQAVRAAGYRLLLTMVEHYNPSDLSQVLNPKTVDGVIFTRWFDGKVHEILPPQVPWLVMSDEDVIPESADKVVMDTATTAGRMVRYLLRFGHERIGLVTSKGKGAVTSHLKVGAQHALRQAGLNDHLPTIEVVYDTEIPGKLIPLMRGPNAPTALMVFAAEKTLIVDSALKWHGFKIPEDVSIISLLDDLIFKGLFPPITATTAMGAEVAEVAVSRLLEKIHEPQTAAKHVLIPGDIIERGSVAPPKRHF